MRWYHKLCLSTTLVASNVLYFGGAIWLLVVASSVRKGGWLDVFEDDYPWFHTFYILIVVCLSLLVATLAISGLYSVLFKRKEWVLMIYAATTLLTFAFCLFLSIEGGISLSTAHAWSAEPTIDVVKEAHVEANFNNVYCVSQAAYLCTSSANSQWLVHFGSDDVRDMFLDPSIAAKVKQAMAAERAAGSARSLLALCEDESSSLHYPMLDDTMASLCTWCGDIADLKSYVHLVSWANTKCPPSRVSARYCVDSVWVNLSNSDPSMVPWSSSGIFASDEPLLSGPPGTPTDLPVARTPPYVICRKTFLSYWSYLSLWFLVLSLAMLVFMVIVIRVAWVVLRGKSDRYNARHGRKPERKPLVQLTARTPAGGATGATTTGAKPTGAMAKAKAVFTKGKTSK